MADTTGGTLKTSDIVDQVLEAKRESEEAFRVKKSWSRRAWSWYNNEMDDSHKEEWQSKVRIPNFAMAVDQAEMFMKQSLKKASRIFGIEVLSANPVDQLLAAFFSVIMHEFLRKMDFPSLAAATLKTALLDNMGVMKSGWAKREHTELAPKRLENGGFGIETVTRRISEPMITVVDPLNYHPDPTGLKMYKIHDVERDLYQVLEAFKGVSSSKVLAALEADRGQGDSSAEETEKEVDKRARSQQMENINAFRRPTRLTEYWGHLFERSTGRLVAKDQRVTIANNKHLLVVDSFPFFDGEDPLVHFNALSVPFSVWGKLLIQHTDSIQLYINELFALMIDSAKMSVLNPLEVDVSMLDDIEDILTGLFPGKLFKTKAPNSVREIKIGGFGAAAQFVFGALKSEAQNAHGITEFLAGLPTSRGRATASETQIKTTQSAGFFDGILQNVEVGLDKTVEKMYFRMMQFMDDWSDPAIQEIAKRFGMQDIIRGLDPVTRYELMKRPFRFHMQGLSLAFRKAEILTNLSELLQVLGQIPEFAARLNPGKLFDKIMQAFDLEELIEQPGIGPNPLAPTPNEPMGAAGTEGITAAPEAQVSELRDQLNRARQ